jgi:Uma2 family endonuclease
MATSALLVQDIEPVGAGSLGVDPVVGTSPLDERLLDEYLPNSIGVKPRYEIIDGVIYMMASPKFWHQRVFSEMFFQLKQQLAPHGCEVMLAPFDLYLFWEEGDKKNYVEPDLFITCDQEQIKRLRASEQDYYHGVPKFIVEILSPGHESHDLVLKAQLYYRAGVTEYWVVNPLGRTIHIFTLPEDGVEYRIKILEAQDTIPLASFPGCAVDFNAIFQDEQKE